MPAERAPDFAGSEVAPERDRANHGERSREHLATVRTRVSWPDSRATAASDGSNHNVIDGVAARWPEAAQEVARATIDAVAIRSWFVLPAPHRLCYP